MTNHYVMPPEQPQEPIETLTPLAAIAGVLIASILLATVGLLIVGRTGLAAWAAFGFGAFFGPSATIAAVLIGATR